MLEPRHAPRPWLWDTAFLVLAACFAWAALSGVQDISCNGAVLDSDLCTYAQGMAGERHPELFAQDRVLAHVTPANSIWNLQRFLADMLTQDQNYAAGLLRAGALSIFVFYAGFYLLGRWLFQSQGMAFLLVLITGVTVWVGWGTFWGVTHSDPIPRVFFAALYPPLLFLAIAALSRPWLRAVAMLAAGLCMWVHAVSALSTGAMFFMAFAVHRPKGLSWGGHAGNLLLCLSLYFLPVLAFLWPSLFQARAFSAADMAVFQQVLHLRWLEDYADLWARLPHLLDWDKPTLYIFLFGALAWFKTRRDGTPRARALASMYPGLMLGLALVLFFSWGESQLAPRLGRLPLAHEFVRGVRFLVPLSCLMVVGAIACYWPRWRWPARTALLLGTLLLIGFSTQDRQILAAAHSTAQMLHLPTPARADAALRKAQAYREALDALGRLVPPGEAVFSNGEDMAVRYALLRPLVHTFKDGYVFYYNKDVANARLWLRYEEILRAKPTGYLEAWQLSGAPWLLSRRPQDKALLENMADIVWESPGWLMARRR